MSGKSGRKKAKKKGGRKSAKKGTQHKRRGAKKGSTARTASGRFKKGGKRGGSRGGSRKSGRKTKRKGSGITVGAAKVLHFGDLTTKKLKSKHLPKFAKCVRNGKDPATGRHYFEVKKLTGKALENAQTVDRKKSPLGRAWAAANRAATKAAKAGAPPAVAAAKAHQAAVATGASPALANAVAQQATGFVGVTGGKSFCIPRGETAAERAAAETARTRAAIAAEFSPGPSEASLAAAGF